MYKPKKVSEIQPVHLPRTNTIITEEGVVMHRYQFDLVGITYASRDYESMLESSIKAIESKQPELWPLITESLVPGSLRAERHGRTGPGDVVQLSAIIPSEIAMLCKLRGSRVVQCEPQSEPGSIQARKQQQQDDAAAARYLAANKE